MSNVKKRSGIPVPSFGSIDVSPSTDGSRKMLGNTVRKDIIAANWKVATLMQLEVSLQHWFRRRRTSSMSLDDFFAMLAKLDWSQTKEKEVETKKEKDKEAGEAKIEKPTRPSDLTFEEELLHDLLCVSANPSLANPLYRIDPGRLEFLPHSADQMRRVFASTSTLDLSWSKSVATKIRSYREAKEKATVKQNNTNSNKTAADQEATNLTTRPVLTKEGTTIDERVRAKAQARLEREKIVRKRQEEDNAKHKHIANDKTWTIQLADALCLHARSMLQRQNYHLPNKLASNSRLMSNMKQQQTSSSRRCVLPFRDIINVISKSQLGEASAVQIAKALTDLAQYSPKFIMVKQGKKETTQDETTTKQSFKWCKNTTTVFVFPDNYANVRSQLTGKPVKAKAPLIPIRQNLKDFKKVARATSRTTASFTAKRKAPTAVTKNLLGAFEDSVKRTKTTRTIKKDSTTASTTSTALSSSEAPANQKKRDRAASSKQLAVPVQALTQTSK